MNDNNNNHRNLTQHLEALEAVLIYMATADNSAIAPASRAAMKSLAHSLVCAALEASKERPLP